MGRNMGKSQANVYDKMISRHTEMHEEMQRDKPMTKRSISGLKY